MQLPLPLRLAPKFVKLNRPRPTITQNDVWAPVPCLKSAFHTGIKEENQGVILLLFGGVVGLLLVSEVVKG